MRGIAVLAVTWLLFAARSAQAVRPFITDDARVVGRRQAQLETWLRGDRGALQHWALVAYGPTAPLELTIGGVHGVNDEAGKCYAVAGPLLQAKLLLRTSKPNSWPGLAVVGGASAPAGTGGFQPEGWDSFLYAAVTESLLDKDRMLVHGNVGFVKGTGSPKLTWGTGSQVRVRGGFHAVGEVFSGDPYAESSGGAIQVGFRHIVSDYVQIDATVGTGIWGEQRLPVWGTVGIRLVTPPLRSGTFKKLRMKP